MTDKDFYPNNEKDSNELPDLSPNNWEPFKEDDDLKSLEPEKQEDEYFSPYADQYENESFDNHLNEESTFDDYYAPPPYGYGYGYPQNNIPPQNMGYPNFNGMPNAPNMPYPAPNFTDPNINKKKAKKDKKGLTKGSVAVLLVVCILLSGICGVGGALIVNAINNNRLTSSGSLIINRVEGENGNGSAQNNSSDLTVAQISDKSADSVVEITTESVVTGSFMQQYISSGAGSGVIISADGYIISNNHVVAGATNIVVTLRNGEVYEAKVVGTDSTLDVALLKVEAENLKPAIFGSSESLKVGDTAVAIGNPLGQLGGTVTTGIISALDRDIDIDGVTMSLLQTNAAINPGNSGGGLFNGQGELIGLVVAKSAGEAVEGLGFAVPIDDVVEILDDLKEHGYVRGRIYTGLSLIDIPNEQAAAMYGLKKTGVYVNAVDASSAAYKAGIQAADRIVTVDGKEVNTAEEIENILDNHKVGDSVEFGIERTSRKGQTTEGKVTVVLEEYIPSLSDRVDNQESYEQYDEFEGFGDYSDFFNDIFGDFFN